MCASVHVGVCVCVHVCTNTYGGQKLILNVLLYCSLYFFFEKEYLTEPRAHPLSSSGWLAFLQHREEIETCRDTWGFQVESLCLHTRCITNKAISPAPKIVLRIERGGGGRGREREQKNRQNCMF